MFLKKNIKEKIKAFLLFKLVLATKNNKKIRYFLRIIFFLNLLLIINPVVFFKWCFY